MNVLVSVTFIILMHLMRHAMGNLVKIHNDDE